MFDILIRNGWVADGTGNPAQPADVAIKGDRITGALSTMVSGIVCDC